MPSFWLAALAIVVFVLRRLFLILPLARKNPHLPKRICLLEPLSKLGSSLPTTWWNLGLYWTWNERETLYERSRAEAIIVVPLLLGRSTVYFSSPELLEETMGYRSTYYKPSMAMGGINRFGPNVVASGGSQWRRHRKITSPAFDTDLNDLVWDEVIRLYGMILTEEGWADKQTLNINSINDYTTKLALGVISACGFNEPLRQWRTKSMDAGQDTLQDIVAKVARLLIPWAMVPSWAFKLLPFQMAKRADFVFNEFEKRMKDKIFLDKAAHKSGLGDMDEPRDVFTRLLQANTADSALALSDAEVLGNCFGFLFAGHETTASSIAVTLALLALHPEEQDRAYEVVKSVTEGQKDPSFADYNLLLPLQSCFYEAVRVFPAAYLMIREASRDDVFTVAGLSEGVEASIAIPAGTQVIIDMIGANRNPRYNPSPSEYKPSRWDDKMEAFLGFSLGPRACLGRKFATVEAICFLALILRDWQVEPLFVEGETREQWMEKVFKASLGVTLTIQAVPLRLTRRL